MKTPREDYMHEPRLRAFGHLRGESTSALTILTWNVEQAEPRWKQSWKRCKAP